ncbi:MAG TPA: flavin reductase family protein [Caulobacteraceae bacterium]
MTQPASRLQAVPDPWEQPSEPFDTGAFRRALAQFATGVAIVTAHNPEGEPVGLTVNSFNSVSLSPPLVLFSLARGARSLPKLLRAPGYAVNILSGAQEALSRRFGGSADASRWAAASHTPGRVKAPLIEGAVARFECEPYAAYDGGDHLILVGRVVAFEADETRTPLVFFRRGYHRLEPAPATVYAAE